MEDAEVFRRFHEAWSAGDFEQVLEYADPEIVARPVHGWLFTQLEYCGHEGLRQWFDEMTGPWDSYETRVEDIHVTPDGVIGFLHLVGHRGEETMDARVAAVAEFRDGRILLLHARDVWDVREELRLGPVPGR